MKRNMDFFWHYTSIGLVLLFTSLILACDDLDAGACQRFAAAKPDMCNDTCLASMCKRHCGLCPLKCYSCQDITDPTKCTNSVECSTRDQRCISVRSFTARFEVVYKLGCAPTSVCSGLRCCDTDLCNKHSRARRYAFQTPSSGSDRLVEKRQTLSSQCADVDELGCTILFTTNTNMCQDDCIANVICPRLCGKCTTCYECDHVMSTEQCMNSKVCNAGEVCFTLETLNFDLQHGYRMGCVPQQVCDQMNTQATNVFGRRSGNIEVSLTGGCCHGDLCNHHNIHQTTTPLSTTVTTIATTTTQKVCNIVHGCPFYPDTTKNSKCYLVGQAQMNQGDSLEYCRSKCAHLAEFDDEHEMHNVISNILHLHHHLDDRDADSNYFYVGAVKPFNTHFIWISSGSPVPIGMFDDTDDISRNACAVLDPRRGLRAVSCTSLAYPICQAVKV